MLRVCTVLGRRHHRSGHEWGDTANRAGDIDCLSLDRRIPVTSMAYGIAEEKRGGRPSARVNFQTLRHVTGLVPRSGPRPQPRDEGGARKSFGLPLPPAAPVENEAFAVKDRAAREIRGKPSAVGQRPPCTEPPTLAPDRAESCGSLKMATSSPVRALARRLSPIDQTAVTMRTASAAPVRP